MCFVFSFCVDPCVTLAVAGDGVGKLLRRAAHRNGALVGQLLLHLGHGHHLLHVGRDLVAQLHGHVAPAEEALKTFGDDIRKAGFDRCRKIRRSRRARSAGDSEKLDLPARIEREQRQEPGRNRTDAAFGDILQSRIEVAIGDVSHVDIGRGDEASKCILWANADGDAAFGLVAELRLAVDGGEPEERPFEWRRKEGGVLLVSVLGLRGAKFTLPPLEVFPEWAFPGMKDQPMRAGASITDIGAATYAVMGILAALYRRERTGSSVASVPTAARDGRVHSGTGGSILVLEPAASAPPPAGGAPLANRAPESHGNPLRRRSQSRAPPFARRPVRDLPRGHEAGVGGATGCALSALRAVAKNRLTSSSVSSASTSPTMESTARFGA